ncbi:MAG: hypothetical protein HY547_01250 [Elusimicrobia bacterium]|nr:hypothetical protein [Elusimicrobiota bacterium]
MFLIALASQGPAWAASSGKKSANQSHAVSQSSATAAEKYQNDIKKLETKSLARADSYLSRIDHMADVLELILGQAKEIAQNNDASAQERQKALDKMDKSQSAFSAAKAAQGAGYGIRQKILERFESAKIPPKKEDSLPDIKTLTKEIESLITSIAQHHAKVKEGIKKQKLDPSLIR